MSFDLTEDQVALRDGIRALVEGRFPVERVRNGFDRAVYDELAAAGVFSLRADGFAWTDAAIVYEELGRGCVPGPLVWSFDRDRPTTGFDLTVPGAPWVEHLGTVDEVLVVDDVAARLVRADMLPRPGAAEWPLDPLTPVWRVEGVAEVAGTSVPTPVPDLRRAGMLLTAAFCVGLAGRLLDLAVDYAKERQQFDRPIASFQAVKHLCADMAVRAELAQVATHAAACGLDDPARGGLDRALSAAKLLAGEAAVLNGRGATQVFGGMGFTWEVDVHLFLKRAWVLDTHFGNGDVHADAVAASMAAPA